MQRVPLQLTSWLPSATEAWSTIDFRCLFLAVLLLLRELCYLNRYCSVAEVRRLRRQDPGRAGAAAQGVPPGGPPRGTRVCTTAERECKKHQSSVHHGQVHCTTRTERQSLPGSSSVPQRAPQKFMLVCDLLSCKFANVVTSAVMHEQRCDAQEITSVQYTLGR